MLRTRPQPDAARSPRPSLKRLPDACADVPLAHLSAAVAHDLNNLLTVIRGNCELLQDNLGEPQLSRELVQEILQAQEQAGLLTRHLLTLSQEPDPTFAVVDLNTLLPGMKGLLRCILGKRHQLHLDLDDRPCPVQVRSGSIERILLNLLCNAREAMTMVGRVTITTRITHNAALAPCVRLTVRDTGPGIDPCLRPRLFQPFVSSRPRGRGLGLAIVASIVEEAHGTIDVSSQSGEGTAFRIDLPAAAAIAPQPVPATRCSESGTILVVEDDPLVRAVFTRILQSSGYFVMEATTGLEALTLAERFALPIHLMVTDLGLPHISGVEVARRMHSLHPETKILLVSGFSEETYSAADTVDTHYPMLLKPFTAEVFLEQVRAILGRG